MKTLSARKNLKATYNSKQKNVMLHWEPLFGVDKLYYVLYRAQGDQPLQAYGSLDANQTQLIDRRVEPGKTYRYTIQARQKDSDQHSERSVEAVISVND